MIRLAICDDEKVFLDKAAEMVMSFNQTHKEEVNFQIDTYISPRLLCDDVLDGKLFDVFLLDMEMAELDGISLATQIREKIPSSIIAFLSSHTGIQYTQEGYKLQALRYVSKLTMETALVEMLEAAIREYQQTRPTYYVYSHYSESIRIPMNEILYIHRVKRTAIIHTSRQGDLPLLCPLKTIYSDLNDSRFTYVDQSCIVNIDQIVQLGKNEVVLKDDTKLPVSRKMMPSVKVAILRLWGEIG